MDVDARSHPTVVEVDVKVGATARIQTSVDDGVPTLEISWGSVTVWVSPHAACERRPIASCDVDRAGDLAATAGRYAEAMRALWTRQEQDAVEAPDSVGAEA